MLLVTPVILPRWQVEIVPVKRGLLHILPSDCSLHHGCVPLTAVELILFHRIHLSWSHVQKTLISWNKIVWSLSVLVLETDKGAWDLVLIRRTLSALWFIKCCADGGNEQKEPKTQKWYNPFLAWFWLLKVHVSWKLFGCLFHSLQMLWYYDIICYIIIFWSELTSLKLPAEELYQ